MFKIASLLFSSFESKRDMQVHAKNRDDVVKTCVLQVSIATEKERVKWGISWASMTFTYSQGESAYMKG